MRETLQEDYKTDPEGGWSYSRYYAALAAIKEWGRLPSEFGLNDPEIDLSVIMAFEEGSGVMRGWEARKQRLKMEALEAKRNK